MNDWPPLSDVKLIVSLSHMSPQGVWPDVPLQFWTPEDSKVIAQRSVDYVSNLKYEKSTDVEDVLTNMLALVMLVACGSQVRCDVTLVTGD